MSTARPDEPFARIGADRCLREPGVPRCFRLEVRGTVDADYPRAVRALLEAMQRDAGGPVCVALDIHQQPSPPPLGPLLRTLEVLTASGALELMVVLHRPWMGGGLPHHLRWALQLAPVPHATAEEGELAAVVERHRQASTALVHRRRSGAALLTLAVSLLDRLRGDGRRRGQPQ